MRTKVRRTSPGHVIGSHRAAHEALMMSIHGGYTGEFVDNLDYGLYREVYVDKAHRVVYKVGKFYRQYAAEYARKANAYPTYQGLADKYAEKMQDAGDNVWNESEHEACQRYRAEGRRWAPSTTLWYVNIDGRPFDPDDESTWSLHAIIAMPFYAGDPSEATPNQNRAFMRIVDRFGLDDMHDGNWRLTPGGHVRITDLGECGGVS